MSLKNRVKILCHICEGDKFVLESGLNDAGFIYEVKVLCPGCNGSGYVFMDKYIEV